MKKGVINSANEITDRTNSINPMSLFGASAMGFPEKISTVRSGMATKHATQRVVLTNPEFPFMYTGAENNFGDRSAWNVTAKGDYKIMKIIHKFKNSPYSPVLYIFKNLTTGKYTCELIRAAENLIEKYGFRMHNNIPNAMEGDVLPKGTPITQTSSYINNNYCAGRNLRCADAVLPQLTEDAIIISDYAAEVLKYDMVDKVTVKLDKHAFLLNKYGDDNTYKPFPDIGEQIKKDIICGIRDNSYLSTIREAAIPHINDRNIFSTGSGIIIDINIFTNVEVENEQFNFYLSQIREYYSEIYSYISTIITDPYQDDTSLLDIYQEAEKYLNKAVWITKEYIADTEIRFTVLQPKPIHVGQKVVGRYGNKSVVAKIVPRHLMPKTDDGRPIDMLSNALAIPNRIIAFATYEHTVTFQAERMWQHLIELNDNNVSHDEIIDKTIEFVNIFSDTQASEIARLYNEYPEETFNDIITNGIYILVPPMGKQCIRDSILECYEKYPDIMKPYKIYSKLRHRWIPSTELYAIGYQYTWVLKQEPSKNLSVVSTGRTTLYDLPVKTHQYNKNLRHYSDNCIKFGEYDTYNLLAGVSVKSLAKISTYFRGSQYEDNSILMSQLNGIPIDTERYNKFPQLDNIKNTVKFLGMKLAPDIFGYNTIGNVDDEQDILFNNVTVRISIPDLRYVLIIYSYYMQYERYLNGVVNMDDFFKNMDNTDLFEECVSREYVFKIYNKFIELLPVLNQIKQYE